MRRFLGSIRFRMVVIYTAVIALAFVAVNALVSGMVEGFLVDQRTAEQTNTLLKLSEELPSVFLGQDVPNVLYETARGWVKEQEEDCRFLYLDTDAIVQMDTASIYNGYRLPYREVRNIILLDMPSSLGFHRVSTSEEAFGDTALLSPAYKWVVYYTAPVRDSDGVLLGVLLYAVSIQSVVEGVGSVTSQIGLVFVVFAFMVGIISLFISGWLTQPILVLTNAIRNVSTQGYSQRVPVQGKDEMAALSEAFNIMSEKLEDHDRLRDEFVSNASHELKTPLSSMKILAESMLYQQEPDPATAHEFFEDIDHEVDRLTQIINDLLQLVREDRGEQGLDVTQVDMSALVQRVIRRLKPLAEKKGLRMVKHLSPVTIEADELRIEQVVSNLVDNAIKYTDTGSVTVSLRQEGLHALLSVSDTGIGISKESVSRLFERFYRVDKARSRDTGGTGLGLSIVERIIAIHNGYIEVESIPDKGSVFTVYLPIYAKKEGRGSS